MSGVKQFDQDQVMDRIMRTFWRQGYAATSIDDLVDATGVKRGSLYNAFGDKEQMFLAAFDRYLADVAAPLDTALAGLDPRQALAEMFAAQLAELDRDDSPNGCLIANTCVEAGDRPDAIGKRLRAQVSAMEQTVYDLLLRAQAAGRRPAGADLRALARFFVATSRGIALMHKTSGDINVARDVAKTAVKVLDAPV